MAVRSLVRLAGGNGWRSLLASRTAPELASTRIHALGTGAAVDVVAAEAGALNEAPEPMTAKATPVARVRRTNDGRRSMTKG
jgi:hypothetical protein